MILFLTSEDNMAITFGYSILYGVGNKVTESNAEGSTYVDFSYTSPLSFTGALEHPVPTNEGIYTPTVGHSYPNVVFMGVADGFWVHRVFLDGHLVQTFTFMDQHFTIPIQFDFVESVSMQMSPTEGGIGCATADCDVPGPASLITLCASAALIFNKRKRCSL